ncbi:MAG: ParB/RepB/Spo0J family partition protein [Spirochaetes bacterium]|nr:ParB/RepB/Spo0J family partition protein [Spirochaetota bacterium]
MVKRALGKGLGAIITSPTPVEDFERTIVEETGRIVDLDVSLIRPNPDQPRTRFDDVAIKGLAESIKSVGLIQPIVVRKKEGQYLVVAGERRLRAAKLAGLRSIKSIIIDAGEEKNLTLALIENIQRSDLDPVEEARAYRVLVNRFKLKQQDIAEKVGKDRATIANSLRLLNLPEDIQDALSSGRISTGHAKVILSVNGAAEQRWYCAQVVERGLSVRALEQMLGAEKKKEKKPKGRGLKDAQIRKMEESLISVLGTKVEIKHVGTKGRIEISYYSLDDFERILELITK